MRRAVWAAIVVTGAAALSGCTVVCSMPSISPPHVLVVARDWQRTHPGGTVHACYDGHCDRENGTEASFEVVLPQSVADGRRRDLAVTLTDATGTVTLAAQIALDRIPGPKGGACPMPDQWSRQVLVRADGRLQFGGADDGRIVVPSP